MLTDTNTSQTAAEAAPNKLIAYRCLACLGVFFSETQVSCPCHGLNDAVKDVEVMGRVVDARTYAKEVCACDARCTHARGPHCECHCGGVNHGTGRTVEKYMSLPAKERAERTGQADWYHDTQAALIRRGTDVTTAMRTAWRTTHGSSFMAYDAYLLVTRIGKAQRKLRETRTIKARRLVSTELMNAMAAGLTKMIEWGASDALTPYDGPTPLTVAPGATGEVIQPKPQPRPQPSLLDEDVDLSDFGSNHSGLTDGEPDELSALMDRMLK